MFCAVVFLRKNIFKWTGVKEERVRTRLAVDVMNYKKRGQELIFHQPHNHTSCLPK